MFVLLSLESEHGEEPETHDQRTFLLHSWPGVYDGHGRVYNIPGLVFLAVARSTIKQFMFCVALLFCWLCLLLILSDKIATCEKSEKWRITLTVYCGAGYLISSF